MTGMTQEQILEILDSYKLRIPPTVFYDLKADIVNYEEQEPTTKNDLAVDCISRKSIKQKLQEHHDFFVNAYGGFSNLPQNDKSRVDEIINCIAMVVNEPPVTPQPRKGHWIECMPGGAEEWCYKCSECNFWKYKKSINLSKFKFCPNCGSRNEVEE